MLSFSKGNAKLKDIVTFSLPAGHSCPFAYACLSKADRETGKLTDGPFTQYRCFSASAEAMYPQARAQRWANFEALKGKTTIEMYYEIIDNLDKVKFPKNKPKIVRIHVSGDFFSQAYFDAWMAVASNRPEILFYAYTKSVGYWLDAQKRGILQPNFKLTASYGGRQDDLIAAHGLKYAKVAMSVEEAGDLPIDHDDSNAYAHDKPFALLIHGMQPAGSKAASALKALGGKSGVSGYSKSK